MIKVKVHNEPLDGPELRVSWWAESDQVPGWTAAADSLAELKQLVDEGVRFALEDDSVEITLALVPFEDDVARGPSGSESGDLDRSQTSLPPVEVDRAIRTTLVSA